MVRNWIHEQYVQEELMHKFAEYCWIKKRTLKRGFVITKTLIEQIQKEFSMITENMILMAYSKVCNNKNKEEINKNNKDNHKRNHQTKGRQIIHTGNVSIEKQSKQIQTDEEDNDSNISICEEEKKIQTHKKDNDKNILISHHISR